MWSMTAPLALPVIYRQEAQPISPDKACIQDARGHASTGYCGPLDIGIHHHDHHAALSPTKEESAASSR